MMKITKMKNDNGTCLTVLSHSLGSLRRICTPGKDSWVRVLTQSVALWTLSSILCERSSRTSWTFSSTFSQVKSSWRTVWSTKRSASRVRDSKEGLAWAGVLKSRAEVASESTHATVRDLESMGRERNEQKREDGVEWSVEMDGRRREGNVDGRRCSMRKKKKKKTSPGQRGRRNVEKGNRVNSGACASLFDHLDLSAAVS